MPAPRPDSRAAPSAFRTRAYPGPDGALGLALALLGAALAPSASIG